MSGYWNCDCGRECRDPGTLPDCRAVWMRAECKPRMSVMNAADEWIDLRKCSPLPGRSYLVATKSVGIVLDVAFFYGGRPEGGLWWTMTNAEFPSSAVTHWASLNEPT